MLAASDLSFGHYFCSGHVCLFAFYFLFGYIEKQVLTSYSVILDFKEYICLKIL